MSENESAPAGAANAKTRGLALNEYERFGELSTMLDEATPTADQWAHVAIAQMMVCPLCFGSVAKQATRENRSIMLATYVCANDHLFEIRWGLAQVHA